MQNNFVQSTVTSPLINLSFSVNDLIKTINDAKEVIIFKLTSVTDPLKLANGTYDA